MGWPAATRSLSLRQGAALSVAGSRWQLRKDISPSGKVVGDPGGSDGTAIALAECLRRTPDRIDPPRMLGSCDRHELRRSAPRSKILFQILRAIPHSPALGEGRPDQPADSAYLDGENHRNPSSWWGREMRFQEIAAAVQPSLVEAKSSELQRKAIAASVRRKAAANHPWKQAAREGAERKARKQAAGRVSLAGACTAP